MSTSTHLYSAALIGAPDTPLKVKGGSITLDAGDAPHVTATIVLAAPVAATLTALDPRLSKRVSITATTTYTSFGTVTRIFNLGLRERTVPQADGTVRLTLASDEALLSDYAPLADDAAPFALASSLRAVVNYALGKAIPGATLQASPAGDADVTAYWTLTNAVTSPRAESLTGFIQGARVQSWGIDTTSGGYAGQNYVYWYSSAAGESYLYVPTNASVRAGESWAASAHFRGDAAGRTCRLIIHFRDVNDNLIAQAVGANVATPVAPGWAEATVVGVAPPGTVRANLLVLHNATAAGQAVGVDGIALTRSKQAVPFFSGATPADAHYVYAWTGTADASASTRTPIIERDPESLTWKAGQSALDFLHPLVQAAGYRLVCDEQRRWTLRDKDFTASGALSMRYAVNLIDGQDTIGRDSGIWFDAAVTTYTWNDAQGIQQTRTDAYALNTPHTRLVTFEKTTPYPGPGFSEYAVRRAQGRGREVTATTVADWNGAAEQPVTIVLASTPTQVGVVQRVTFDLDTDRMSVTTRATDTPLGAIDLLVGTIDSLVGTIDSL